MNCQVEAFRMFLIRLLPGAYAISNGVGLCRSRQAPGSGRQGHVTPKYLGA